MPVQITIVSRASREGGWPLLAPLGGRGRSDIQCDGTHIEPLQIRQPKSRLAAWRPEGQPNPFEVGKESVANYFKVMEECSLAAESLLPQ
jgi:hypothetical protein